MPPPATRTLPRRAVLAGGAAVLAVAGGGYYAWTWRRPFDGVTLSPPQAHRLATSRDIFLIDIRRPDEWVATGVPEGAHALDMRRADFIAKLREITRPAPDRPVALICARGVRSSQLTARLQQAGMDGLVDVPEGMLGSRAGPGWLVRGLPVVPPSEARPSA